MSAAPFLLDGEWTAGAASAAIASPWDGAIVAEVALADASAARAAAVASARAAPALRALTPVQRADALRAVSTALAARVEAIAAAIRDEVGKPLAMARTEVQRASRVFAIAAEEALRPPGEPVHPEREPHGAGMTGRVERFPVGPVLGIGPFNFPLNLIAHKVAPALAAGCPIVVKPPPQGPSAALALAAIVRETALPRGALQVLTGGADLGRALCACPEFAVVSFTGSAAAGWAIKRAALPRQRTLLELGGNAATIVDDSADLEAAARAIAHAGYAYAGQICISTQRVIATRAVAAALEALLVARIRADARVADGPADADALVGPLIDVAAADRIDGWIARATARGARALIAGERRGERLITPWLLRDVPADEPLVAEEAFGPVVVVETVPDLDAAIAAANASRYGLQTSVFTRSPAAIARAYAELEAGAVLINTPTTFRLDSAPYGGVKDSGLGREGVAEVMRELTEPKLLLMRP